MTPYIISSTDEFSTNIHVQNLTVAARSKREKESSVTTSTW